MNFDIVVPTIGRPSLRELLRSLREAQTAMRPERVVIVDDRRDVLAPLDLGELDGWLAQRTIIVRGAGCGPATARNIGWRACGAEWIAFLDDDVAVAPDWFVRLRDDLAAATPHHAGSQGRVHVPLPAGRAPTDWERNVAALAGAAWITADMAYRRDVLQRVGGFDERFRRAYREDADLALRVFDAGYTIAQGARMVIHRIGASTSWSSVSRQTGNADDVLMRRLHGPRWRERASAPRGMISSHACTVALAAGGTIAFAARARSAAALLLGLWAARTCAFAWRRIAPGPRTSGEIAAMAATSVAIPFAAVFHRLRAELTLGFQNEAKA